MRGLGEDKYDSKIKLLDIVQVIFDYLETIEIDQKSVSATCPQALDGKLVTVMAPSSCVKRWHTDLAAQTLKD